MEAIVSVGYLFFAAYMTLILLHFKYIILLALHYITELSVVAVGRILTFSAEEKSNLLMLVGYNYRKY